MKFFNVFSLQVMLNFLIIRNYHTKWKISITEQDFLSVGNEYLSIVSQCLYSQEIHCLMPIWHPHTHRCDKRESKVSFSV